MPSDMGDIAANQAEYLRQQALKKRKDNVPGPKKCLNCGFRNDRASDGYGICTDCFEEINCDS